MLRLVLKACRHWLKKPPPKEQENGGRGGGAKEMSAKEKEEKEKWRPPIGGLTVNQPKSQSHQRPSYPIIAGHHPFP